MLPKNMTYIDVLYTDPIRELSRVGDASYNNGLPGGTSDKCVGSLIVNKKLKRKNSTGKSGHYLPAGIPRWYIDIFYDHYL